MEISLSGVKIVDENYFIITKRNYNLNSFQLYLSDSLENKTIKRGAIICETQYSSNGKLKSYKQPSSNLNEPVIYRYYKDKVDLMYKKQGVYSSCDLPYIGEGSSTIHDINESISYVVNTSGNETLFFEIKNGNVIKISTVEHVLYEYTYDNNPYFGKGILYDFFSTEFDLQWWFIPEFIPKNNITSIKQYSYSDGGRFSPEENEIHVQNFVYKYNEYHYPIQMKMHGEIRMIFFYDNK